MSGLVTAAVVIAPLLLGGVFLVLCALVERVGELAESVRKVAIRVNGGTDPDVDVVEAFKRGHTAGLAQAREELANVRPIKPAPGKGKGA